MEGLGLRAPLPPWRAVLELETTGAGEIITGMLGLKRWFRVVERGLQGKVLVVAVEEAFTRSAKVFLRYENGEGGEVEKYIEL